MYGKYLGYLAFAAALILSILLLPNFMYSNLVSVSIATLLTFKIIPRLSLIVLGFIVFAATFVLPLAVLFEIGRGVGISPLHQKYLSPLTITLYVSPTVLFILAGISLKWLHSNNGSVKTSAKRN